MPDNGIFDFEGGDFSPIEFDAEFITEHENRYCNPQGFKGVPDKHVHYEHAKQLARDMRIGEGGRVHALVSGNFVAGDLIEALFTEHDIFTECLSVSTLSLNDNNVDSFANLLEGGYVSRLDLIVSDYFFAHERNGLVRYMYEQLDHDDRFQLAVAGSHTKIAIFQVGKWFYSIHGSANLRSSGCLEQLVIEEGREVYEFYKEFHDRILTEYSTINKSLRSDKLWQAVQEGGAATTEAEEAARLAEEEPVATAGGRQRPMSTRRFRKFRKEREE